MKIIDDKKQTNINEDINRNFIELPTFKKSWDELNLTDEDLHKLQNEILKQNNWVPLGTNVYKIRFSPDSLNKGKSNSDRVIFIDFIKDSNIYLVTAFSKSDEENITKSELTAIRTIASKIGA